MALSSRHRRWAAMGPVRFVWAAVLSGLAFSLDSIALPEPAVAQQKSFDVEPSITFETIITDNADFETPGRADLQPVIRPGLDLVARGRSYTAALVGSVGLSASAADQEIKTPPDISLLSTGDARFFDDRLAIDGSAAVNRQSISPNRPTSARGNATRNTALVKRFSIGPTLEQRLGDFATARTNLGIAYLRSDAVDSADEEEEAGGGGDTETRRFSAGFALADAERFRNFSWRVSALREVTDQTGTGAGQSSQFVARNTGTDTGAGTRTTTSTTLEASGEYRITPWLFALASGGYEDIEDPGTVEDVSGPFGTVGARIDGTKLDLTLRVGHRYGGPNASLDATYRASPRTFISAAFERRLETEQQRQLRELDFLGVDENGAIIDTRFPEFPLSDSESLFGLEDLTRLNDTFSLRLRAGDRRNTYIVSAFLENSETTGSTSLTEIGYGGQAVWQRRLSRRTTSNLGGDVRFTNTESSGVDGVEATTQRYTAYASLVYELSSTMSGSIAYSFRSETADDGDGTIRENAIVTSLTKRF